MRAHRTFTRRKGGTTSEPLLGSDPQDPNTPTPVASNADTVLATLHESLGGNPPRRLLVVYTSTAGAPPVLQGRVWFFEQAAGRWFTLEAAKALTVDTGTFFDLPAPHDPANGAGGTTIHAYLQVSDNAGGNGLYAFAMTPTLS